MNKTKWALITGAAGGIGQALVTEFENTGYRVIACDKTWDKSEQFSDAIYRYKSDLQSIVESQSYREEFADYVANLTNGNGISVLINNAAVQILGLAEDISAEDWKHTWDVNFNAAFFMIQLFLESLKSNRGSVVNISSIHASLSKPGFVAYATSKAALSALCRNLALEMGDNLRINAIEPAAVQTQMLVEGFAESPEKLKELNHHHPLGRIAKPREVAELALFLCSDKSAFLQGATLSTSGGIHSRLHDPD